MAGNTIEERLARVEEQLTKLQALTQGLAAWEMGGTGIPETDKETTPARVSAPDPVRDELDGGRDRDARE
jgi:hypothetical protein